MELMRSLERNLTITKDRLTNTEIEVKRLWEKAMEAINRVKSLEKESEGVHDSLSKIIMSINKN